MDTQDWFSLGTLIVLILGGFVLIRLDLRRALHTLDGRIRHLEGKTGDGALEPPTTERVTRAERTFARKAVIVEGATEAAIRIEAGRTLLREAATEARLAAEGKVDWSSKASSDRAWLDTMLTRLTRDILSHDALSDLRSHEKARQEKRKQRGQRANGKEHFVRTAEYFERLADGLMLDDLDPDAELPGSFPAFKKTQH